MSENNAFSYKGYAFNLGYQVCLSVVTHPLEFAEFLMQIGYAPIPGYPKRTLFGLRNTFRYVRYIRDRDGCLGCYRGLLAKIRARATASVVEVAVIHNISSSEEVEHNEEDANIRERFHHLRITLLKELREKSLSIIVSQPMYVIAWRVMGQFVGREQIYSDFFSSVSEIYHKEGVAGYFSGLVPRWVGEAIALVLYKTINFLINNFLITEPLLKVITVGIVKYVCYGLTYPFVVAAVCCGVNDSGLACGKPPIMPVFAGWTDAWRHLWRTGRLYSKVASMAEHG